MLIGSGIGVTPYASILQSVLYRYKAMRRQCPVCDNIWFGRLPASIMKLKKVSCDVTIIIIVVVVVAHAAGVVRRWTSSG